VFVWDEAKREKNLIKHGYDFADAHLVYDDPTKVTVPTRRNYEDRLLDTSFVQIADEVLALAYVERGDEVRVISFRRASRKEREHYEQNRKQN
jgi:uncharacterized DUF497 family protein